MLVRASGAGGGATLIHALGLYCSRCHRRVEEHMLAEHRIYTGLQHSDKQLRSGQYTNRLKSIQALSAERRRNSCK